MESWTDIIVDNAPSRWVEYIKGSYSLSNESFEFSGRYTDENFENFVLSRFGNEELEMTFAVTAVSQTEIILDKNEMFPTNGIRLVK